MSKRSVEEVVVAHQQREGGGFLVRRPFPSVALESADPFLLLDEMGPVDYGPGEAIGAPDHPHRGFETVTYVLDGESAHEDSAGHRGVLGPGDVQWMTAGRGVVHSEMPSAKIREQGGRLHGFQLWVNLPAKDKMMAPRYQEIPSARIPEGKSADGKVRVKVVAGESLGQRAVIETQTPISYLHFELAAGAEHEQALPDAHRAYVYVFRGVAQVAEREVKQGELAVLGPGTTVALANSSGESTALLLLSGVPIKEPIAWYGPFVMNTPQQIRQAVADFQSGKMGEIQR